MSDQIITIEKAIELICETQRNRLSASEREDILLDWWVLNEDDREFFMLDPEVQYELIHQDSPDNVEDIKYDKLIDIALTQHMHGVRNSYLEMKLKELGIGSFKVKGEVTLLEKCPCCELLTLKERGVFEVCPACNWEDTGDNLNAYSGPNHMTLQEGKDKLKKHALSDAKKRWKNGV